MKKLNGFEKWENGTTELKRFTRVSNWIEIKHAYKVNKNNQLWDYVVDSNMNPSYSERFDSSFGVELDYFKFKSESYALGQFLRIGGSADSFGHRVGYIENDDFHLLHAVDSHPIYKPLYLEFDEFGERVRLYEMGHKYGIN